MALAALAWRRLRAQRRGEKRKIPSLSQLRRKLCGLAVFIVVTSVLAVWLGTRAPAPNRYVIYVAAAFMFLCAPALLLMMRRLNRPEVQERLRRIQEAGGWPLPRESDRSSAPP